MHKKPRQRQKWRRVHPGWCGLREDANWTFFRLALSPSDNVSSSLMYTDNRKRRGTWRKIIQWTWAPGPFGEQTKAEAVNTHTQSSAIVYNEPLNCWFIDCLGWINADCTNIQRVKFAQSNAEAHFVLSLNTSNLQKLICFWPPGGIKSEPTNTVVTFE